VFLFKLGIENQWTSTLQIITWLEPCHANVAKIKTFFHFEISFWDLLMKMLKVHQVKRNSPCVGGKLRIHQTFGPSWNQVFFVTSLIWLCIYLHQKKKFTLESFPYVNVIMLWEETKEHLNAHIMHKNIVGFSGKCFLFFFVFLSLGKCGLSYIWMVNLLWIIFF
jgi:hypothetical protein